MGEFQFLTIGTAVLCTLVAGLAVTRLSIAVGYRLGFVVKPRLYGRCESSITYLGGPALAVTSIAGFLVFGRSNDLVRTILLAGIAVLILGFVDDRLSASAGLTPRFRVIVEVAIAAAAWRMGVSAYSTGPVWVDALLTVVFLVAGMNAFNLVDNMDGVAGSTAAAVSFGIMALALAGNQPQFAVLAACIGGATAAFLCFNFARPRVYLGDAGSLFLGLVLSGMALTINAGFQPPGNLLAAAVIFAVPFTDTATRQLSRWVSGSSPFNILGGTDHLSHRLVDVGFSPGEAARLHGIASLLAGAAAGIAALMLSLAPLLIAFCVFAGVGLMFVWLAWSRRPLPGLPAAGTDPVPFGLHMSVDPLRAEA